MPCSVRKARSSATWCWLHEGLSYVHTITSTVQHKDELQRFNTKLPAAAPLTKNNLPCGTHQGMAITSAQVDTGHELEGTTYMEADVPAEDLINSSWGRHQVGQAGQQS